ncbi:DUF2786 domain-containing protein [Marispirochaeta aestuarii]|uniref:DUF2786 domain-containing protein n=1 Tax=Marispirochaeta aestuarii TaxID=1963862 RepID=UPI0029C66B97|nr:DUF2786 domain-containing protein [Marispirochaeta aestuarii]
MNDEQLKTKKLIERIKKLFALTESPNESESAAALDKAKELLAKHKLSIDEIKNETALVKEKLLEVVIDIKPWEEELLSCITNTTFTEILVLHIDGNKHLQLIGREANIITAKLLYEYLHDIIMKKGDLFHECIDDIESFRLGMIESIKYKLKQRLLYKKSVETMKYQIVVVQKGCKEENMSYINREYGKTNMRDNWYGIDENSYGLGKSIGSKISINSQLPSN